MPNIESTRKAFKAFAMDTGKHRVSSEALYRRVRQAKPLYQINSLVDVNNIVSLIIGFSLGSYDTKNIGKELLFRLGNEREEYEGIAKSSIHLKNIPLLSDNNGAFGSPVSDSIQGMITPTTQQGLTVIYSFSGKETLQETLDLTKKLFTEYASITDISSYVVQLAKLCIKIAYKESCHDARQMIGLLLVGMKQW